MANQESISPVQQRPLERINAVMPSILDLEAQAFDTFSYLRAYWQVLLKRQWTIHTITLVLTALVTIVSFKMRPVYQAAAKVEVEADTAQIQSLSDLYRQTPTDDAFLATQITVLQSDNLAWRTIEQLGLAEHPDFAPLAWSQKRTGPVNPIARKNVLLQRFQKRLSVQKIKDSRVVSIGFENNNADLAARIVNALVNNYLEYNFYQKYDATRQASGWMEQQLDELKAKVEKSQQNLVDYERQNSIVSIGDKETVVAQKLTELTRDLTNAQAERLQRESLYELASTNESQVALLASDPLLQRLEEKS